MNDAPTTQGQRLRQMRLQKRYTQDYVAAQLSTTKQAIYKYETDIVRNIPTEKLIRLAQLYGCSTAYLQGFADEPGEPPAGAFTPVDAPCGVPHHRSGDAAAEEAQLTFYRDLTDALLGLTPAERTTVLRFAQFLAAGHQPPAGE